METLHAPDTPSAAAVERTMAILECLDTSRRGLNVSELSRRLSIPKSSAHVLVLTLERLGYVQRAANGRDFCLALKTYALGQKMAKMVSVSECALPHMQTLADRIKLNVHLGVLDHDQAVYIQKAQASGAPRLGTYVGRRSDLHCTALGKVILAFTPDEATDHIFEKKVFIRYTPKTITSAQGLRREVARVRKLGYAMDDQEEELGMRCLAVAVLHEEIRFIAAISVSGTVSQIASPPADDLLFAVRECAARIAAEKVPLPPLW
jgi:DNA-binding IclR family transcriptional regulator